MKLLFLLLLATQAHANLWTKFCSSLLADDPYQYEAFTTDQLVSAYNYTVSKNVWDEVMYKEIQARLEKPWKYGVPSDEDKVILSTLLLRAISDRSIMVK